MHNQITKTLQRPDHNMNTIVNMTTLNPIVKLSLWYTIHPLRPLRTFLSTQNNCSKNVSDEYFFQIFFHRSFSQPLFFPKILNIIFFLWFLIFLLAIKYSVHQIFEKNDQKWLIFNIKSDRRREIFYVVLDPWICQRLVTKLILMHY